MSQRATRAVISNLNKLHGDMWEGIGERMAGQPFDQFVERAQAWLRDRSELKDSTINGADYAEVYAYFTEGN